MTTTYKCSVVSLCRKRKIKCITVKVKNNKQETLIIAAYYKNTNSDSDILK